MSARKLLLLTALVVALFGFIFFIERRFPSTAERQQKGDLHWELPEDRIEALRLERAGSVVELARARDKSWRLVKPEPYPADGPTVSDLVSQLAKLRRASDAAAEASPEDYGLVNAPAKATIFWREEGKENKRLSRSLELGLEIPGTDATAARVTGTSAVLFVPTSVAAAVKKSAADFKSKDVFAGPASDIAGVEIERGRGRLTLSRKNGAWWLQQPVTDLANADAVEKLVTSLTGLRALEFVPAAESQNLAALGLAPPLFRVTLSDAKRAGALVEFGATRSDGNSVYARREGQALTVGNAIMEDLSKEAIAFREPRLLRFDRASAVRLEGSFPRGQFALERKEAGWTAGGKPVTAPAADDLLSALLDVKSRSFSDDATAAALATREPAATVVVSLPPPEAWTLKLYRTGADSQATVSDRPGAFLLSGDTAAVLEAAFRKASTPAPPPATPSPAAKK